MSEKTEIRQLREVGTLMTCVMKHEVSATTAQFKWNGPQLNAIWPEVLAFFKWTYDEYKSESQLRLYVNTQTKEWKAWAYPQRARTGMSAYEIDTGEPGYDKTMEQLKQFDDTIGWVYWGTVHHHCASKAFQSSVDENNERSQNGLHITVGTLDKDHFDIHARIYIDKFSLVTHLADFWDIGDVMNRVPPEMKPFIANNAADDLAKHQMGIPPDKNQKFPDVWKSNIVEYTPKPTVSTPVTVSNYSPGGTYFGGVGYTPHNEKLFTDRSNPTYDMDLRRYRKDIYSKFKVEDGAVNLVATLRRLGKMLNPDLMDLLDLCFRNDCKPFDIAKFIENEEKQKNIQQRMLADRATNPNHNSGKKVKKNKGNPDMSEVERMLVEYGPFPDTDWNWNP